MPALGLLDPAIISRIPIGHSSSTGRNCGENTEAWVWPFLKACLTTIGDEDEANAIVMCVQASYLLSPYPETRT